MLSVSANGLGDRPRPTSDELENERGLSETMFQWLRHFFSAYAGKEKHTANNANNDKRQSTAKPLMDLASNLILMQILYRRKSS